MKVTIAGLEARIKYLEECLNKSTAHEKWQREEKEKQKAEIDRLRMDVNSLSADKHWLMDLIKKLIGDRNAFPR